ncbi:ASCH domain-containing protein [Frankineae bacterium MT45]|nr:ASCH domain-containing protein [Frankineae bacterium MT45]
MQFSPDLRDEVASGAVTASVRLWRRPKVRVGGRYPVAGAIIEVTSIELIPFRMVTADDVRRCGEPDREALRGRAAHAGPITDDTPIYLIEFQVAE